MSTGDTALLESLRSGLHAVGLLGWGGVLCRDFLRLFLKAELTDHCVLV